MKSRLRKLSDVGNSEEPWDDRWLRLISGIGAAVGVPVGLQFDSVSDLGDRIESLSPAWVAVAVAFVVTVSTWKTQFRDPDRGLVKLVQTAVGLSLAFVGFSACTFAAVRQASGGVELTGRDKLALTGSVGGLFVLAAVLMFVVTRRSGEEVSNQSALADEQDGAKTGAGQGETCAPDDGREADPSRTASWALTVGVVGATAASGWAVGRRSFRGSR